LSFYSIDFGYGRRQGLPLVNPAARHTIVLNAEPSKWLKPPMTQEPYVKPSDFEVVRCLSLPLADKLDEYYDRLAVRLPHVAAAYQQMIDRLVSAEAGTGAPKAGDALPAFLLPDESGKLINSEALLSSGPLVVSLNRGHWCPFCRLELLALNEIYPDIESLGAEVVSITPQRAGYMRQLRRSWDIRFPFLSDMDNAYVIANNLVVMVGDALSSMYQQLGIDLAEFQASVGQFLPIPATYVVAPSGEIVAAHVDPDFRKRMAPDDILRALRSI
jgi:peroxiredoxin